MKHILAILFLIFGWFAVMINGKMAEKVDVAEELFFVEHVVDGDTIVLDNGEKVRLIGVDTPETVHPNKGVEHYGIEASEFTENLVEEKNVHLGYDETTRDKYNRLLAYVYLEDGTLLNAEIIKQGYGFAYLNYPFKLSRKFEEYEQQARKNRLGLWK